jgi:hypothetical protein
VPCNLVNADGGQPSYFTDTTNAPLSSWNFSQSPVIWTVGNPFPVLSSGP